ncbi:hypothetical protein HaLaN_28310 [Haematococcus lacustris]|uniref:Uncharacterized protein n=1 Tax=Haematococcus lacustris TaxID=44745 RepID=A0A6A0ABI1_HAELA|nr:hypothetical protein HaLaN_28310 [Haematococcus lacustris]
MQNCCKPGPRSSHSEVEAENIPVGSSWHKWCQVCNGSVWALTWATTCAVFILFGARAKTADAIRERSAAVLRTVAKGVAGGGWMKSRQVVAMNTVNAPRKFQAYSFTSELAQAGPGAGFAAALHGRGRGHG